MMLFLLVGNCLSGVSGSLSLVNALSACCLSTWLPSSHREWSVVELVKTLANKAKIKSKDKALDTCISADQQGTVTVAFSSLLKELLLDENCHI